MNFLYFDDLNIKFLILYFFSSKIKIINKIIFNTKNSIYRIKYTINFSLKYLLLQVTVT